MAKNRNQNEKISMIRREIIPSGSTDGDTTAQNLEKNLEKRSLTREQTCAN